MRFNPIHQMAVSEMMEEETAQAAMTKVQAVGALEKKVNQPNKAETVVMASTSVTSLELHSEKTDSSRAGVGVVAILVMDSVVWGVVAKGERAKAEV
jgi:hypothetical protein